MKRNADYIATKVTGFTGTPEGISVDLTVMDIKEMVGTPILTESGMEGVARLPIPLNNGRFVLEPWKAYEITFNEGLSGLSSKECATIIQRSTLNRCGVLLQGCIYEPEYACEHLKATIYTSHLPIWIKQKTAVAQILIEDTEPFDNKILTKN